MKPIRSLLPLLVLLACAAPATAQPQLNFKRLYNNWPTIDLYFTVSCNGTQAFLSDKKYFQVTEDGIEVTQFELWCPDQQIQCPISVAFALDASGSMAGAGNAFTKAFCNAFIDGMDGITDEAAILWFNATVTTQQTMTNSADLLHSAVNALPATGGTTLWDGVYAGLLEIANRGVNACRSVIVVSDGADGSSTHTMNDALLLASRNRIRVFTIGYGPGADTSALAALSSGTGGMHYSIIGGADVPVIVQSLETTIRGGFKECMISYESPSACKDGSMRIVDLTLRNYCNGGDTKTKSFKAPLDSSTFSTLRLGIGSANARGNAAFTVPLRLLDAQPAPFLFNTSRFTVLFDAARVTFNGIAAPAGTLLEGIPLTVAPIPGGVTVEVTQKRLLPATPGSAALAELTFRTSASHPADTLHSALQLRDWTFSSGCLRPSCSPGGVTIFPMKPAMLCGVQAPARVAWDSTLKDYTPNPVNLLVSTANMGDVPATNVRFTLVNDPARFQLVSPSSFTQQGSPAAVQPGATSQAQWELRLLPGIADDTAAIRVTAAFDNHPPVACEARIFVPVGGSGLACSVSAEDVRVHPVHQRYEPMPFTVTATVRNTGMIGTDDAVARLVLPPGFALAPPDMPGDTVKSIGTGVLFPAQFGTVAWHLTAAESDTAAIRALTVEARSRLTSPSHCTLPLAIPGLGSLRPRLSTDADTIDFGIVLPGSTADAALGLVNTGARTLHLTGAAITGVDAAEFSIVTPPPDSLQPTATGSIALRFAPSSIGNKTALLQVTTDDPVRPSVAVVLLGAGKPTPRLAVNQVLDFGTVRLGDTRDTTLDLRNSGFGALDLNSQTVSGGDAAMFRLVIPAATPIAQSGFSRMTLRFLPSSAGPKTSNLTLVSSDSVNPVQIVTLTGNGTTVSIGDPAALPGTPELLANHPNPFSASTDLAFTLPEAAPVRVAVVDALGREVALLHEGMAPVGATPLRFEATRLPDGLYFAVLRAGGRQRTLPMVKAGK